MRENRREGVGREVRKWDRLFFSSSYHRLILLAFALVVVGSSGVSPCVSLLACRLAEPVRFRSVVRPSFSSSPCSSCPFSRSCVSFLVSLCACRGGGAIDAMWHGMGRPWLRVMMGMGVRPSVVLVLLACSRLPARMRSPRLSCPRLLACRVFFSIW